MAANSSLDDYPVLYCVACGEPARRSGPAQTTCPNGHIIVIWSVGTAGPQQDTKPPEGTWRDRPSLL